MRSARQSAALRLKPPSHAAAFGAFAVASAPTPQLAKLPPGPTANEAALAARHFATGLMIDGPKHTAQGAWQHKKATAMGFAAVGGGAAGLYAMGVDPQLLLVAMSTGGLAFDVAKHVPKLRAPNSVSARVRLWGELAWKNVFYGLTLGLGHTVAGHGTDAVEAAHGLKHAAKAGVAGMLTAGDAPMFLASGLGTHKDGDELGEG